MKNKWRLIIIFFSVLSLTLIMSLIVKVPMYKPVQFSSIKFENSYKYFISTNDITYDEINELRLYQNENEFIIKKESIKFNSDKTAEIKNNDKKFNAKEQTKAMFVLNSERIMYYLINKTFSRK